jgi:hypothetical protein
MLRGLFWFSALFTQRKEGWQAYEISRGISLGDSSRSWILFGPIKSDRRIGGFSLSYQLGKLLMGHGAHEGKEALTIRISPSCLAKEAWPSIPYLVATANTLNYRISLIPQRGRELTRFIQVSFNSWADGPCSPPAPSSSGTTFA